MNENKVKALLKYLENQGDAYTADEVSEGYDADTFEVGSNEYLVLTDDEADQRLREYAERDAWAFNAEFIASHTANGLNNKAIEALKRVQGELCEDANDLVLAMIEDLDAFAKDAAASDGRGHFLAGYDGEENEAVIDNTFFFIYRQS